MKKRLYAVLMIATFNSSILPLTLSPQRSYPITNNNTQYEVHEISSKIGQLTDGTWVKLVCIKKGMIGMPNVSMPSYRGKYINKNGESCYVFVLEPEGEITFKGQTLKVYHVENEAFLSDGTKVKIECLAPGAVAKIAVTSDYRGTYYLEDPSGDTTKRQQCNVQIVKAPIYRS